MLMQKKRTDLPSVEYTYLSSQTHLAVPNISIAQPVSLNNDHRYKGISCAIQPISSHAVAIFGIVDENTGNTYVYHKSLELRPDEWRNIYLNFSDFHHISTRLRVDTDAFHSGQSDRIHLFLIIGDYDIEYQGVNWSAVTLRRQNRLYQFY